MQSCHLIRRKPATQSGRKLHPIGTPSERSDAWIDRVTLRARRFSRVHAVYASDILAAAQSTSADLIAMATRGRSGIGRALFGSVAESVLRASPVPVFEEFKHITSVLITEGRQSPVIQNQLPVNLSVMICSYGATCWGNHSCSHCWLSSTTFKMPSALLPVGLQLIPLCF